MSPRPAGGGVGSEPIDARVALLSAPVLLTIYRYHGEARHFGAYFPGFRPDPLFDFYSHIYQFASFFLLAFLLPFLYSRLPGRRKAADLGFGAGDVRLGAKWIAIGIPLAVVPILLLATRLPDVRDEYPLAKILATRHDLILWYDLAYVFLYYLAWEFYFRGFLLFTLRGPLGDANAILVQTIPSCLVHIGKPEGEILGSIAVGILFGSIALRTGSIWYVFVLHAAIGLLTDWFILFL
jgi:membrane protease YdiL (CAAX protease family)